jgi:CspA family cold shock protein
MSETPRLSGCVKWFNKKTGYGFINVSGEDSVDYFVHFSGLSVSTDDVFRFLVEGEYVEFSTSTNNEKVIAVDVTGPQRGKLMCEHRVQHHRRPPRSESNATQGDKPPKKRIRMEETD